MKTNKSKQLLAEIRHINKELKILQIHKPSRHEITRPEWDSSKSRLLNARAHLVVQYIKSLRIKAISVEFLKSILL